MTVFQTSQNLAPDISLTYDEEKQQYMGRLVSRTGVFEMTGPDKNDVMYQIAEVLRDEGRQLLRELDLERGKESGRGRGGSSSQDSDSHSNAREGTSSSIMRTIVKSTVVMAIMYHMGPAFELLEGLSALGGMFLRRRKPFKVMFCGMLITAPTRRLLRKKLVRAQNRRIEQIMRGVRLDRAEKQKSIDSNKRAAGAAKRVRAKRKIAQERGPNSWERKVAPKGKEARWEDRVDTMRVRIADKKQHARDLWTSRA